MWCYMLGGRAVGVEGGEWQVRPREQINPIWVIMQGICRFRKCPLTCLSLQTISR